MADYYFDINTSNDSTPGQNGSQSNPYNWDNFLNNVNLYGNFYVKGNRVVSSQFELGRESNVNNIYAWDKAINGPWRLNVSGCESWILPGHTSEINTISDLILYSDSNVIVQDSINNAILLNSIIKTSVELWCGWASWNTIPMLYSTLKGCRLECNTFNVGGGYTFYPETFPNNKVCDATLQDTILKCNNILGRGSDISYLTVNRCTINRSSFNGSNITVNSSNVQVNWTPVNLPEWSASQSSWTTSIINGTITTPPNPGTTPYTGYATDLWGNARNGIGTGFMGSPTPSNVSNSTIWISFYRP